MVISLKVVLNYEVAIKEMCFASAWFALLEAVGSFSFTQELSSFLKEEKCLSPLFLVGSGILFVSLCVCLYYEVRYLVYKRFLKKCKREAREASSYLDPDLEGKLVYVTGRLQVSPPVYLTDPTLPVVTVSQAFLLKRTVQMYLWKETLGNENSKSEYFPGWSSYHIDSGRFQNPVYCNPSWDQTLQNAVFKIQPQTYLQSYKLTKEVMKKIPIKQKLKKLRPSENPGPVDGFCVYIDNEYFYLSNKKKTPYTPEVGDYRIKYSYLDLDTSVSILGEQRGNTLKKYRGKLLEVARGNLTLSALIENKLSAKRFRQYIVRIGALISSVIGFIVMT